jgi:LIVCS family branched-chain amino acid:cation transporter
MISTGQCAFSLIFMSLVYVFSLNKNNLLTVLGRVLGPINIFLMLWLIAKGLWTSSPSLIIETESFFSGFFLGFKNGFWTFELLATVFFAAVFFGNVKHFLLSKKIESSRELVVDIGIKAGAVSAFIFSLVYAGFITISSLHSQAIGQVVPEKLLSAYAYYFLGNTWGGVSTLIVALSCFCTTLALTMVFSDYLVYLSSEKISYRQALLLTIFVSLGFSNLGFSGIKTAMEPLVTIFYPVLMILVAREAFMFFLRKHRA